MCYGILIFAVDLGKDSVKERMEDLVMKGALEAVVEICSLKCLPPLVHLWQPHQPLFFLGRGNFQASCPPSYSHVIVRMTAAACMMKILMEARIQEIQAASEILNWFLHLMANLAVMDPKDIVLGEASLGKLENAENETTDVKENGKGSIHSKLVV